MGQPLIGSGSHLPLTDGPRASQRVVCVKHMRQALDKHPLQDEHPEIPQFSTVAFRLERLIRFFSSRAFGCATVQRWKSYHNSLV